MTHFPHPFANQLTQMSFKQSKLHCFSCGNQTETICSHLLETSCPVWNHWSTCLTLLHTTFQFAISLQAYSKRCHVVCCNLQAWMIKADESESKNWLEEIFFFTVLYRSFIFIFLMSYTVMDFTVFFLSYYIQYVVSVEIFHFLATISKKRTNTAFNNIWKVIVYNSGSIFCKKANWHWYVSCWPVMQHWFTLRAEFCILMPLV